MGLYSVTQQMLWSYKVKEVHPEGGTAMTGKMKRNEIWAVRHKKPSECNVPLVQ